MVLTERLDKIISSQLNLSRKQARISIFKGEVSVDGKKITDPSAKIDPAKCNIQFGDDKVNYNKYVYIMMNKPQGVLSASRDGKQQTAVDIIDEQHYRKGLYPAGRLDKDSTGLLLLTDDGDFCHKVISPKSKVYKTYYVELDKTPPANIQQLFLDGLEISENLICQPAYYFDAQPENDEHHIAGQIAARVKICEGKFHQVKRMFEALGVKVTYLKRESIGMLKLDKQLKSGQCRYLTEDEINSVFLSDS